MTINLTEERKQSIYTHCQNILSNYQATIRDLAQTIEVIVPSFRAAPYDQMYYRELEKCKVQSLARSGGNFDRKAYISEEAADELQWWIRNIFDAFAPIKFPPFDLTIFSDASLEGWGGTDQVTEIGGRWNCMENKCHINSLELQAAFFCLKAFCKNKTRLHVLLKLDNTTAVAYINKKGGTISASCNKLAKDIWNWAKGQDIWITASHVPGVKNTTADLRSRLFYDNKEWSLNERVAKSLFDQFGKPEIDLFASRLNTKCSKYASCKPDPDAYRINAFSLCWLNLNSYIFPPFSIVGRVLAKLAQDRATALVIVPCWQTQPWFPQFVRLVKPGTTPLLIPAHQHLLQLQAAK